jgi:hypothetical protein
MKDRFDPKPEPGTGTKEALVDLRWLKILSTENDGGYS